MHSIYSGNYRKDFITHFKGDITGNLKPRQTPGVFYAKAVPTPVTAPAIISWNEELAEELGVTKPLAEKEIAVLAGNQLHASMFPYAARYGGHQFGHWAGQLGDGRAIVLGEWITPADKTFEFQLKGPGQTAYSRRADGRAVLRSSVREYLMSEAMHYLRVPTTRALSLVNTGDQVLRDMFYDGHPAYEPGAIVMRVAPSFLRFGNYEIYTATNEVENLRRLTDWTIEKHFPSITGNDRVLEWYREVVRRTAFLMVEWLRVGFVHGVMNTDNMSILGLTIDYGPYSFLDEYDPAFTPNTTDLPGRRYSFGRQPSIGYWNLACLANALVPLFKGETGELEKALHEYEPLLGQFYHEMMAAKLGFDQIREEDQELLGQLEEMLATIKPDMTLFYRLLMKLEGEKSAEDLIIHFQDCFYEDFMTDQVKMFEAFISAYQKRKEQNTISSELSLIKMQDANPAVILRNYQLHQAIEGLEMGDDSFYRKLEQAMKHPYSEEHADLMQKRPEWAGNKAGCSMLSCSS